jgi:hypothetical protein
MARDADLLPWILGGLLALSAAIAVAVNADGSGAPQAPGAAAGAIPAANTTPASTQPHRPLANASSAASDLAPVEIAPTARQQLPPGQVWECEINGVRVFSDTQCGAHASVRQLRDLNVMDANSAPAPYRYPTPYPATNPYPPGYSPSAQYPTADDYGSDPYVSEPYVVVHDRYRHVHPQHPTARPHPRAHN